MNIAGYIDAFVEELRPKGAFIAPWLEDAVRAVPRHCFIEEYYDNAGALVSVDQECVSEEQLKLIYSDSVLRIRMSPQESSASQPSLVAWMLADLDVQPGQKVLDIGTGTGWNAGLLRFRAGRSDLVCSIDVVPDLVEQAGAHLLRAGIYGVHLRAGDGGYGWPEEAPFDRIMATVGCPDIPPAWPEQLAEGGILLVPLKTSGIGDPLIRLTKQNGHLIGGFGYWPWFVNLQGDYGTGAEDVLMKPLEPWLDSLLQEDPRVVALPEVMTRDCLFFLRLKGLRFQGVQSRNPWELLGGYLHLESGGVFSPDTEWPVLRLYGYSDLGKLVADYQKEWIRLGRPVITDFHVELVDGDAACRGSQTWLDKRRHACLRFALGRKADQ